MDTATDTNKWTIFYRRPGFGADEVCITHVQGSTFHDAFAPFAREDLADWIEDVYAELGGPDATDDAVVSTWLNYTPEAFCYPSFVGWLPNSIGLHEALNGEEGLRPTVGRWAA